MASTNDDKMADEFTNLCTAIGYALMAWESIETAHFKLFLIMLGAPQKDICSAVYHSVESFEARHKMVGRMAHFFLQGDHNKEHRVTWSGTDGGLSKSIKNANDNRNKLAHYGVKFDVIDRIKLPDGSFEPKFGPPRWRPHEENKVSHLLGRTPDNPEHDLGATEIHGFAGSFLLVAHSLTEFWRNLALPPPQLGLMSLSDLGRPLDRPTE